MSGRSSGLSMAQIAHCSAKGVTLCRVQRIAKQNGRCWLQHLDWRNMNSNTTGLQRGQLLNMNYEAAELVEVRRSASLALAAKCSAAKLSQRIQVASPEQHGVQWTLYTVQCKV